MELHTCSNVKFAFYMKAISCMLHALFKLYLENWMTNHFGIHSVVRSRVAITLRSVLFAASELCIQQIWQVIILVFLLSFSNLPREISPMTRSIICCTVLQ